MAPDPAMARLLAPLRPSERALRDWVVPRLDTSMVKEIAAADYGVDVVEHQRAVEELCRSPWLPRELDWHPGEVLALTRWSNVDSESRDARRQHIMRLFCCLYLIHAEHDGPVNSVTPLVASAVELGPDAVQAAAADLAWCRLHEPGCWPHEPTSRPVLTLALVALTALLPAGRTPELLPGLVAAFADELHDVLAEENVAWTLRPLRELFKRTALAEARRSWRSLADRCLLGPPAQETGHGALLAQLGQAVKGDLVADAAELRALLAAS